MSRESLVLWVVDTDNILLCIVHQNYLAVLKESQWAKIPQFCTDYCSSDVLETLGLSVFPAC